MGHLTGSVKEKVKIFQYQYIDLWYHYTKILNPLIRRKFRPSWMYTASEYNRAFI
jgi:hypothetical protein